MGIAAKSVDLATFTQPPSQPYTVDAVKFSGNGQIQYDFNAMREFDFRTSVTTTQPMTVSFWIKPDMSASQHENLMGIFTNLELSLQTDASNNVRCRFYYSTNSNRATSYISWDTAYGDLTNSAWNHVVYSTQVVYSGGVETWQHRLRVNGTKLTPTFNDGLFDQPGLLGTNTNMGSADSGTWRQNGSVTALNACVTEFVLDENYYDLDTTSELRKFYSATGKPVEPPVTKLVHLTGNSTTWSNKGSLNLGTRQIFTNITDCADSPSD